MFSTSVGRVVRSSCTACSQPSLYIARLPTPCLAAASRSKPLIQRSHQRRHSSSKASIPPDGSKGSTPSAQPTSSGRVGRRKSKDAPSTAAPTDTTNQSFAKQYPNLPRVESTQHLHPKGNSSTPPLCHFSISDKSRSKHVHLLLPPSPHLRHPISAPSLDTQCLLLNLRAPTDPK
jgi:hypothetical protein